MKRKLLIFSGLFTLLVVALSAIGWVLLNNEAFIKNQIQSRVLSLTGRELTIGGPLKLTFGRQISLTASDIGLQNADWSEPPDMLTIDHLQLELLTVSLWSSPLDFSRLEVRGCLAVLDKDVEGNSNWSISVPPQSRAREQESPDHLWSLDSSI